MKINLTPSRIKKLRPKPTEFTVWDSATSHFGVRVAPTGAMRFIHLATVDGKLKKRTIGDARTMPLDEARAIARDIDSGDEYNSKPCPLLREWVDIWWQQAQTRLKPGTQKTYRYLLDRQLLPALGKERLDAINRSKILSWFERYSRDCPINANHSLSLLSTILNNAKKAEIINKNPARRIQPNPKRKLTRFLSDEERCRLLAAIDALPPRHRAKGMAIRMLLFTGCRLNEILTLKWKEVGDNVLNLEDSKTGARRVWLGPEAIAILEDAKSLKYTSGKSEFVFPSHRDSRRCNLDIWDFWGNLRKQAGIPDVRLHDLRHSFATEAVRRGVALPVVSKLLGHSSMQMTMRYAHASNAEVEQAAERIADRIASQLGEEFFLRSSAISGPSPIVAEI